MIVVELLQSNGRNMYRDFIGLLFRINKLCMAKVKYFRTNLDKFEPLKYDYKRGFVTVPL